MGQGFELGARFMPENTVSRNLMKLIEVIAMGAPALAADTQSTA
jgi:hypothetical protein